MGTQLFHRYEPMHNQKLIAQLINSIVNLTYQHRSFQFNLLTLDNWQPSVCQYNSVHSAIFSILTFLCALNIVTSEHFSKEAPLLFKFVSGIRLRQEKKDSAWKMPELHSYNDKQTLPRKPDSFLNPSISTAVPINCKTIAFLSNTNMHIL